MKDFRETLASGKRLLFDGAMGTMLQMRGLPAGESPEAFCLTHPDVLEGIYCDYIKAGADIITTNTFGGTCFKLPESIDVFSFNRSMAASARKATTSSNKQVFVAGSIGPTGKFLRPLGELSFDAMVDAFREQIRGLIEGGVDLIIAETQFDIAEARAIVVASRRESNLPIAVSMTYEDGITLTGSNVAVAVASLINMGVDLIGMNCSAGPKEMESAALSLLAECSTPVLIQPNAGIPELKDGVTLFPLEPEDFSSLTYEFAKKGAQVVGGCCGTTPAHIGALREKIDHLPAVSERPSFSGIALTSRSNLVRLGKGYPLSIIGERINPTGKKVLTAQFQAGEFAEALKFADEQVAAGATILDVNTGAPMVDEKTLLPELVMRLINQQSAPLSLDSPNPEAIQEALKVYPASPLVNSISGEKGRMELLGPLCKEFGAPFILLPIKGSKLPETAEDRIAILDYLLNEMDKLGIPRSLAIVDLLVLSVSSNPTSALTCVSMLQYCEQQGLPTTCGLSNISFGLPARELLNASFVTLSGGAGLSSCIANPSSTKLIEAIDSVNLLMGHDKEATHFVDNYAGWKNTGGSSSGSPAGKKKALTETEHTLESAVIEGRKDVILSLVEKELSNGVDPFSIVGDRLIPAITEVGKKYESKEYFLPQLIRSAETMQTAFGKLKPLLEKDSRSGVKPVIVVATVEGDIHDIGKNIVTLMLGNYGFEVKDLGKDVAAETIVKEAEACNADLIGLSALMTTTMVKMQETVTLLKEKNLPQKVMVGGAVVTDAFARSIGAHYSTDAVDAVRLAKELLAK